MSTVIVFRHQGKAANQYFLALIFRACWCHGLRSAEVVPQVKCSHLLVLISFILYSIQNDSQNAPDGSHSYSLNHAKILKLPQNYVSRGHNNFLSNKGTQIEDGKEVM